MQTSNSPKGRMRGKLNRRVVSTAVAFSVLVPGIAFAQDRATDSFPQRPIKIVVPFPPGGTTDVLARTLAEGLKESLGQPVFVENKPGAGGLIGSDFVKNAPADGYTLLLTSLNNHIMMPLIQPGSFQPQRDLASVGLAVNANTVLAVSNATPAKTLAEFTDFAKKNPGKVFYSSSGNGSFGHFFSDVFRIQAGAPLVHIPYKGAAPSVLALVSDEVQMLLVAYSAIQGQAEAGQVRVIAQDGSRRSPLLPSVPTFAESGYPSFQPTFWLGVSAPKGTPGPIVAKLNRTLNAILKTPAFQERARKSAWTPVAGTPTDMDKRVESDIKEYAPVIKRLNIKPD
jgi:tripartite-type tricarboxylate transporter receptor subunit TctC